MSEELGIKSYKQYIFKLQLLTPNSKLITLNSTLMVIHWRDDLISKY